MADGAVETVRPRWRYFALREFVCKCGCGQARMAHDFVTKLDKLRTLADFPFIVSSGYRCPAHNGAVSSTGRAGPHTTGRAVDIRVHGPRAFALLELALYPGALALDRQFTGIGISQRGPYSARFVHLDDLSDAPGQPRPWVWSYPPPPPRTS